MTLLPLVVVLVVLLLASTALALGVGRSLAAGRRIDRRDAARPVATPEAVVPVRREVAAPGSSLQRDTAPPRQRAGAR